MDEDDNMSDSDFGEDEDPDKIEVPGTYYKYTLKMYPSFFSTYSRWRKGFGYCSLNSRGQR